MIYIVVPVFNEEAAQVRRTLLGLLMNDYKIILVNDGCNKSLKNSIADLPVHYLRHSINLGQGAALQTGVEYALLQKDTEFIIHFDADGQHDSKDINVLIESLIKEDIDIVLGSRFLGAEASRKIPFIRKSILLLARFVNYFFTGILLTDAHNGLRAMNLKAAQKIFLTENSYAHATEILSEIKTHKLKYKEISVTIHYSDYSKRKGQKSSNMFAIFLDLVLSKLFR